MARFCWREEKRKNGGIFWQISGSPFLEMESGTLGWGSKNPGEFRFKNDLGVMVLATFSFFGCVLLLAVKVKRQRAFLAQGKQEAASC